MTHRRPTRQAPGRIRWTRIAVLLVVVAALAATLGHRSSASPPSVAATLADVVRDGGARARGNGTRTRERRAAEGALPGGTTVFADGMPGVARLDPALLAALRRAATDAANAGVEVYVDSGWRSAAYQERLLREAITKYGSEREASRWVADPDRSAHTSGDAVDVGPSAAAAWLSEHGAAYGLCRIYGNEPWHFELRPQAVGHGCAPMYADPSQDPRLR